VRLPTDSEYGWAEQCVARFGTHPAQVCHEWNTAVHAQGAEGDPVKRAFTLDELQSSPKQATWNSYPPAA
jgi:integrase/recombinase XerC